MDKRVYWMWLQHAFGAGSPKPYSIFKRFKNLKMFYESGPSLWNTLRFISGKEAHALFTFKIEQAEALLEFCDKIEQEVMTPECEKYPDLLRNIFDPPAALYVKGYFPDVDNYISIGIVGGRGAKKSSIDAATAFAYNLCANDAIVVSGNAVGVDTSAIKGALSAQGRVISVLPASISSNYLSENAMLRERITDSGGVLVSEYAVETGIQKGTFQVRNRLISGLSWGTLIIEAKKESGTMITAKHSKNQDRDIFVLPGEADDPHFAGSAGLIEDGAKAVTEAHEILCEYEARLAMTRGGSLNLVNLEQWQESGMPMMAEGKQKKPDDIDCSENAKVLFKVLTDKPTHVEALAKSTDLSIGEVLSAATELEIEDLIRSHAGSKYSKKIER